MQRFARGAKSGPRGFAPKRALPLAAAFPPSKWARAIAPNPCPAVCRKRRRDQAPSGRARGPGHRLTFVGLRDINKLIAIQERESEVAPPRPFRSASFGYKDQGVAHLLAGRRTSVTPK